MLYIVPAQRSMEIIILLLGIIGDFCHFPVIFAFQDRSSVPYKQHFYKFISPKYIGQGCE